ncbi:MAG: hypothetical protein V1914_04855 [archaeon]
MNYNLELRLRIEDVSVGREIRRELSRKITLPFIPRENMGLHLHDDLRVYIRAIDYRIPTDDFVVYCQEISPDVDVAASKYLGKGWKVVGRSKL